MNNQINLLPPELRKHSVLESQSHLVKLTGVGVLVIIFLGYAVFGGWIKFQEYYCLKMKEELKSLQPKELLAESYEKENRNLSEEINSLEKIQQQKVRWTVMLQAMNDHLPHNVWMTKLTIDKDKKIQIRGITNNLADIGVLLYQLNGLSHFNDFTLEKAQEIKVENLSLTEFSLQGTWTKGREQYVR